jgi:hypothetical protein
MIKSNGVLVDPCGLSYSSQLLLQRSEYKEFEVQEDAAIENDQKMVRIESERSSVDWRPASANPYSPWFIVCGGRGGGMCGEDAATIICTRG